MGTHKRVDVKQGFIQNHLQFVWFRNSLEEMKNDGVDDAEGETIFLVEQRSEEDAVCAVVVHLGDLEDSSGRMQHGNRVLFKDTRDNDCFTKRTRAFLKCNDENVKDMKSYGAQLRLNLEKQYTPRTTE